MALLRYRLEILCCVRYRGFPQSHKNVVPLFLIERCELKLVVQQGFCPFNWGQVLVRLMENVFGGNCETLDA